MASGRSFPAPPEFLSSLFAQNPKPHPQPPKQ
jgi:hypothetical protein